MGGVPGYLPIRKGPLYFGGAGRERCSMKKLRKHSRRGAHYRALAEGYSMLNPSVAESFRHAADYYDNTDPPFETEVEDDELRKTST